MSSPFSSSSPSFPAVPSSSPSALATTTPAVLSFICQQLRVTDLLRLLRCCSALRRLSASDASFSSAAWSAAWLELQLNQRLDKWTLPRDECVSDKKRELRIPLSVWQQAVPVIQYTLQRWEQDNARTPYGDMERASVAALKALLAAEPATSTARSRGEEHVVLSELSLSELGRLLPWHIHCFRGRFVLAATPYLQHLRLTISAYNVEPPPAAETLAFVPRLRSLHIQQEMPSHEVDSERSIVPIRDILAALPSLTELRCEQIQLGVQDMLDIAAHVTLERIQLSGDEVNYLDQAWLGRTIRFTTGIEEETERQQEGTEETKQDSADDSDEKVEEAADGRWSTADTRPTSIASTRVKQSRRSVVARLELANFLHRRLRGKLRQSFDRPLKVLQQYRQQAATLRSTLRKQLAASASAAVRAEGSGSKRGTKRARSDAE